ncbi:aldose 1-epimerase [Neobacillus bataviensis LMG 21833]|uniref:Aldose 1-epimerase n=1 Tax=Neobacillus bataviensis LMG 21833 TaxID=1117379 RepID=K6DEI8_9BACI|nr:aldose epimerase family protein [Neobacillus bataviensis]EKN66739.1 aldose 1-epimerase [Neobacillus bataviensis LMG 21833]
MKIEERVFGNYEGTSVIEYSLINDSGMTVHCLNYGCVITKIIVPDRHGNFENVVLGFEEFEDYVELSPYFGAVVGRVAGRIKDARFELDGNEYLLADNEHPNHIHGGRKGLSSVVWETEFIQEENAVGVKFVYHSPDGEEGYPGNLDTTVTYLLNNKNELITTFEGKTDQTTIVNLTNHSYYNLSGNLKRDCSEHILKLDSNRFLELAPDLIPTGQVLNSKNTSFDFQYGRRLLSGINSTHPQNILVGNGYDHPLIFTKEGENQIVLSDEESGRTMLVTTNQPCVVLYTSNQLEAPFSISGVRARKYLGVCLETQGLPDAIHHPEFPSVILQPEEVYYSTTTYRFFSNTIGD